MNTQVKERIKRAFIYAGAVIALVAALVFLYNHTRNTYLFCWTIWETGFYMEIDRPSSVKIYDDEFFSDGAWHTKYDSLEFYDYGVFIMEKQKQQDDRFPYNELRLSPFDDLVFYEGTLGLDEIGKAQFAICKIIKKQKRKK